MSVVDRPTLDFMLMQWLDLPGLLNLPRFHDHDVAAISAILDLAERLASERLAPTLRPSDSREPWLDESGQVRVLPQVAEAVRAVAEAGLFAGVFENSRGGLQLPYLAHMSALGVLMSGSIAAASYMLLTVANGRLIATFGAPEQVAAFADPQIAGQAFGTMCLSESQAGSSLADIVTRAEPDGSDALGRRYRLRGAKMWISAGDHDITDNIIHLVLAKAPAVDREIVEAAGAVSLFIVPKRLPSGEPNDVAIAGLNHKMGYRGIPNCVLNLGEGRHTPENRPGAIGWLVGDVGQGLAQMFQMMNEARVSVGLGGAMLASRGYLHSLNYARARPQGRPTGERSGPQVSIVQHADVRRMLLAQKSYAEGALGLVLYTARFLDIAQAGAEDEREAAELLLGMLTPITKTWPSEWAQVSLDLAIQIHGGAGYTRDFEVELLYRDNRLNPIHEGTTGIQAIDLVGRKLRKDQGAGFRLLTKKVDETLARATGIPSMRPQSEALSDAWTAVAHAAERLLAEPETTRAIAAATPFLFALGHAVVGWLWLDQALACLGQDQNNVDPGVRAGKLAACRYFSTFELPKVSAWLAPLADLELLEEVLRPETFDEARE